MDTKLEFTRSDLIKPLILNLCDNIEKLYHQFEQNKENIIDLSDLNWVNPLSILPIASLLFNFENQDYKFKIINSSKPDIASYLKTICFYSGVHSREQLSRHKNYIPIVSLPNKFDLKSREQVLSCLLDILLEQIGCRGNLYNAIGYAFSEMFDNVWEHSQTDYGWFFAQYYKNKVFADLCFIDNGITIKGSYERKGIKIKNDIKAISLSLGGKSTKDQERGFGLWTKKKLVTQSPLQGKFLILSGCGGYYENQKQKLLFNLSCFWHGTIILLRINKTKEAIDYIDYIE